MNWLTQHSPTDRRFWPRKEYSPCWPQCPSSSRWCWVARRVFICDEQWAIAYCWDTWLVCACKYISAPMIKREGFPSAANTFAYARSSLRRAGIIGIIAPRRCVRSLVLGRMFGSWVLLCIGTCIQFSTRDFLRFVITLRMD